MPARRDPRGCAPRPRARGAAAALVGALVLGVAAPPSGGAGAAAPPAAARPAPAAAAEPEPGSELPPLGPLPEIAPELAEVAVHSAGHDAAVAERDRTDAARIEAERLQDAKAVEVVELTVREGELTTQIDEARRAAERWEATAARLREELRTVAVATYISGVGQERSPLLTLDASVHDALATEEVTAGSLAERQLEDLDHAVTTAAARRDEEARATDERTEVRAARDEAVAVGDQARRDRERLEGELVAAILRVDEERRLATVDGADFPLVVLDAYWKGAAVANEDDPGCGIPWWALAGIGLTESRHGTFGGAEVRADGTLTRPIIGIPLTGGNGTAHIGDSDGGRIDGDATYDRAAGPMQFIPQTWARWGRDGDGDGDVEIQTLYDAAAGAAAYLCASGPMTDDAGMIRGFFSYNHSGLYVAVVLDRARGYEASVPVPGSA